MKPILYYLCGYRSSSRTSPKFTHFQHSLDAWFDVRALDYPQSYAPLVCRDFFQSQIDTHRPACFMGSSLGGFWANWLANQHAAPCVLLNPCCRPSRLAAQFPQEHAIFADFATLENTLFDNALPRLVFLAQNDNVLDYRQTINDLPKTAKTIIFADGGHVLWRRLPEIDRHISAFLQRHHLLPSQ